MNKIEKSEGAICGGNREKAWEYINQAKDEEEFKERLTECLMAIMQD